MVEPIPSFHFLFSETFAKGNLPITFCIQTVPYCRVFVITESVEVWELQLKRDVTRPWVIPKESSPTVSYLKLCPPFEQVFYLL